MRLGGQIFEAFDGPESWAAAVRKLGYRAAYCPVGPDADDATARAYAAAAGKADIVIAEVGVWCNTIDRNEPQRRANIARCQKGLDLAERIGARCCVNVLGSRGSQWAGPDVDNLSRETFELAVETVREIIDAVHPKRTAYTVEMMGWVIPDSAESCLELLDAVDRPGFAVHLDPVNLINSPRRYYENGKLLRHTIRLLGPYIRSVHAKDVTMSGEFLLHLDECRPGMGTLDYAVFLEELSRLDADLPVMMEHLPTAAEYEAAAAYIREVARRENRVV